MSNENELVQDRAPSPPHLREGCSATYANQAGSEGRHQRQLFEQQAHVLLQLEMYVRVSQEGRVGDFHIFNKNK